MHPLETYLKELRDIRLSGGGVKETSYYAPLAALLNEAGKGLRPKVRTIVNLRDTGGGIPDGGFFTQDQFPKASAEEPAEGQLPERGALEVKGLEEDVLAIAETEQVEKYLGRYGQVLVTNLRDFVLVGADHTGQRRVLESFRIASSEDAFLEALKHPRKSAAERGEPCLEYLKRVLLRPAPLAEPKDLAWFLASYAKDALARVEASELPALTTLRESLEGALGIRFEGERGEHFFRSTLVQTLFYGAFSAWVLWSRQGGEGRFNWRETVWNLRVPMIRTLFHQVANPARLQRLELVEVLDWTAEALNRVDRTAFFTRFREEHAVQYFYEPFLEAFDPELRRQLGVWYTPPEVVKYMVAKVDHVLRTELDVVDGLADPRVVVLDPCCGTGAYLVEVLHRIERTLREKGDDALLATDVKKAALTRVFGFDIMPAPFVVAHLQLGLLVQQMEVPFAEEERAGVYLTNALTGWVPPKDPKDQLTIALPELAEERDQADHVKREAPILVILGNPPYSGYAGIAIGEERDLTDAYRITKRAPKPQGQGLNDLYVRFFRMAERMITEMEPHRGVVCFISNYSWLDGLSFTGMRERFIERFDRIDIDSLNGDKYRTGKLTPEGDPDPSIFSTETNREGIQVGTAITTLVRKEAHETTDSIRYRDLWGKGKLAQLEGESEAVGAVEYEALRPAAEIGYPLMPRKTAEGYLSWPKLPELFPQSFPGIQPSRDEFLVDIDRDRLEARIERYMDPGVPDSAIGAEYPSAMAVSGRFDGPEVRKYLVGRGTQKGRIIRYCYRPFDVRWLYWEPETKLLDEKRSEYVPHVDGNMSWVVLPRTHRRQFDPPVVTSRHGSRHIVERGANLFPISLLGPDAPKDLFAQSESPTTSVGDRRNNLSALSRTYMDDVGAGGDSASALFHHVIAVLYSPSYRAENEGALRQDWPRVPLPGSRQLLDSSAELGRRLAALLNPESPVVAVTTAGVTTGAMRPELRAIAPITRVGGGQLDPDAGDLDVTARWGYAGARGVTMPGKGRAEARPYTETERDAILSYGDASDPLVLLGNTCVDVYLNDRAYWRSIPSRVWEYTLGGYQVIKKWLSYREKDLLGRGLKPDEVREVTNIARRIAAILLMEPELDENYRTVAESARRSEVH
ncbi:MAG: type ISP restriction/modification enzyme [Gemmatimonadota bacterium]